MFNPAAAQLLMASVIAGILGVSGFLMAPLIIEKIITVSIEPEQGTVVQGEAFTIKIIIDSNTPINVYKGLLRFDDTKLEVTSISYNTSIADLWAEEPWYSNGDGTVNFIGGTTKSGGFTGVGSLVTITFTTKSTGEASIYMEDIQILAHDGLGTTIPITVPIDAVFAISAEQLEAETKLETSIKGPTVTVIPAPPDTDLNDDGKQSLADTSIFMSDLVTQNRRSDFNQDNVVNLKDLSILTQ
jgi:Cohesin domain